MGKREESDDADEALKDGEVCETQLSASYGHEMHCAAGNLVGMTSLVVRSWIKPPNGKPLLAGFLTQGALSHHDEKV